MCGQRELKIAMTYSLNLSYLRSAGQYCLHVLRNYNNKSTPNEKLLLKSIAGLVSTLFDETERAHFPVAC